MYQQDQLRPELNQGMHIHVHQCVCTNPLYNPYRSPFMAYVPQALPRNYNLSNYQYPSYNMPYTIPIYTSSSITNPPVQPQEPIISERRQEPIDVPRNSSEEIEEALSDTINEDFTKFLEKGCNIAEKIAVRNQHRPCFKNIQNLCNRTKNEILKQSHTVSNIHSQGIPWGTKDFIYAYIRLINCWHMLKGYLDAKPGTLGSIEKELTNEFKSCYSDWEANTKMLSKHMIQIFSNLDKSVSNPGFQNNRRNNNITTDTIVSPVSGIIDNSSPRINKVIEGRADSSRCDGSDESDRSYMMPGCYNLPKIPSGVDGEEGDDEGGGFDDGNDEEPDYENAVDELPSPPPSIEFLKTARNVGFHFKTVDPSNVVAKESDWRNAIDASPSFIRKNWKGQERGDSNDERKWINREKFDGRMFKDLNLERRVTNIKLDEGVNYGSNQISRSATERNIQGMKELLEILGKTTCGNVLFYEMPAGKNSPDNIRTVYHKFNSMMYKTPSALVYDLKRIIKNAAYCFKKNPCVLKQIEEYSGVLNHTLSRIFPDLIFDEAVKDFEKINC